MPVDPWAATQPEPGTWGKAPVVGDSVTLPSGLVIRLTSHALRQRPWAAVQIASVWYVCGKAAPDEYLAAFFLDRMRRSPHKFEEADARARAKILNAVR